jgi:putative NIF3 family GTP cyclohydrolase 1 type 2
VAVHRSGPDETILYRVDGKNGNLVIILVVHGSQLVRIHVTADAASEALSRLLVEAVMDAAVDPRIVDVICDVPEIRVLQRHAGNRWSREHNGVAVTTEEFLVVFRIEYRYERVAHRHVQQGEGPGVFCVRGDNAVLDE